MLAELKGAGEEVERAEVGYRPFPDVFTWVLPDGHERLWARYEEQLQRERSRASPDAVSHAVEISVREAAIDSPAIEGFFSTDRGFTRSVALQGAAWEHRLAERSDLAPALFRAQLEAFDLVIDAATGRLPITEAWIRRLHEILCGPQTTYRVLTPLGWQDQPLVKGRYKQHPNSPQRSDGSFHHYAPPDRTPQEMDRLVAALSGPLFDGAHPAVKAAFAHHSLVHIHPFADGNGRVARALASVFLYRAGSIPLVVFADQKARYLDALEEADGGERSRFVEFVADRGIDAMAMFIDRLRSALPADEIRDGAANEQMTGRRSTSYADAVAERLLLSVTSELMRHLEANRNRCPVHVETNLDEPAPGEAPEGFRFGALRYGLRVSSASHPSVWIPSAAEVVIALHDDALRPFRLRRFGFSGSGNDVIDLSLQDLDPELSHVARVRLRAFAERWATSLEEALRRQVEARSLA